MKRLFLATTALVMLSVGGPAIAADMAVKARPLPPPPPPACAQFGGFYLGANVGYGYYNYDFHDRNFLAASIDDDLPRNAHLNHDNWNAGVQIGYNWQWNCAVFGFEADWSWTNLRANDVFTDGDAGTQDAIEIESRLRWFGTVRAKTGVVVGNTLLYVTGGLAYARFDRALTVFEDAPATAVTFASRSTRWGWTAGVGSEWAFSANWSLKSEFLYMRFQRDDSTHAAVTVNGVNFGNPGSIYGFKHQDEVWVTRLGLNYRFNYAPVVARY